MHSIKDIAEKIKGFIQKTRSGLRPLSDDLFLGLVIILVAFGSFGLGRLSKIEESRTPIRIENAPTEGFEPTSSIPLEEDMTSQSASVINSQSTQLVASKNGKKYYYPWCNGVQKISPANLIYFKSKIEAEARGYTPSSACKGL